MPLVLPALSLAVLLVLLLAVLPVLALALALAACARDARQGGFKLGNPGIMMGLYPAFWGLYNGLPEPALKREQAGTPPAPARRRIRTNAVAVPPEMPEEY